ncbi:hypothetical protein MTO96_004026 [Rhipicephalus appendiculatus]
MQKQPHTTGKRNSADHKVSGSIPGLITVIHCGEREERYRRWLERARASKTSLKDDQASQRGTQHERAQYKCQHFEQLNP